MSTPAFLHPFAPPARPADDYLTIVRGEGAAVYDANGKRYVDALAGLWFSAVGHGRHEIAHAVYDQLQTLEAFHCFDRYTNQPADELCNRLVALSPVGPARVFLVDSGSEAVDTALKLARLTCARRGEPERHLVVAREHAYHGVTYGGLTLMGLPANTEGWGPLEGVRRVGHDDLGAVEAVLAENGEQVAAVVAEPVIGAGGVRPVEAEYLRGLRELCDRYGALLVLDEVITAFGRLGRWWGAERFEVQPDMVTFAKGVTSGYMPLGGVMVGRQVLDVLERHEDFVLRTGHTYSGHPGACRAALVNLDIIAREELARRADEVIAPHLSEALGSLLADDLIASYRGLSGIWAIDVPASVDAVDVRDRLLELGVLVRQLSNVIIGLCPPLVIDEEDLARITTGLRDVLGRVRVGG